MAALAAQGDALWPLLAFVAIVALNLAKWLLYRSKTTALATRLIAAEDEAAALRREAARLTSPSDLVARAKLERRATALEREASALKQRAALQRAASAAPASTAARRLAAERGLLGPAMQQQAMQARAAAAAAAAGGQKPASGGARGAAAAAGGGAAGEATAAAAAAAAVDVGAAELIISALKWTVVLALVFAWWGAPVAVLPIGTAWPFGGLLAFPHARRLRRAAGPGAAVTAAPFLALADRVSSAAWQAAFPVAEEVTAALAAAEASGGIAGLMRGLGGGAGGGVGAS